MTPARLKAPYVDRLNPRYAAHAGTGGSDSLQITDANLATYQALLTSLS